MTYENSVEKLKNVYKEKIMQYGDRPEGVQWSSVETQEKRFEVLLEIADIRGKRILDFGCGTGALFGYLQKKNISAEYTGCDIVEEALQIAADKYPHGTFLKTPDVTNQRFDYIFISGVFNNKLTDNVQYYQHILCKLYEQADKGLAFNMMSAYVDYYDENLFYERPEKVFSFVKSNLSPYVTLRNDYQIKYGILPFEFAVYVYRKD